MAAKTLKTRLPFAYLFRLECWRFCRVAVILGLTGLLLFLTAPTPTQAATTNTLNFQARLQTSAGAIVPDGYYNIEFKLYNASSSSGSSQGSCSGDANCLWTETWYDSNGVTAGNDNRLRVKNGYVTVDLGSLSSFPGTVNWDQDLWITIRAGGSTQTASPTWDSEMSPRLRLNAVPYAFRAGQLAKNNGSYTSILELLGPTGGDQTFQVPDQGAGGTYTLLTTNAANAAYVQFAPAVAQTDASTNASIFINKTGGSGNILDLNKNGGDILTVQNSGTLHLHNNILNQADRVTIADPGPSEGLNWSGVAANWSIDITPLNRSNADGNLNLYGTSDNIAIWRPTLQVYNATNYTTTTAQSDGGILTTTTGSGHLRLNPGGNVGIGSAGAPSYKLDVTGDINTSTGYRAGGTAGATTTCSGGQFLQNAVVSGGIITGGSCTSAGGSGVTTVGTLDGQTKSANGAVISGTTIYMQTADGSNPGLVSTGTQTFAGDKTFSNNLAVSGTYNTNTFTSNQLAFGGASAASIQSASGQALTVDSGTTAALNLGTGANAKTITIGNVTGATSLVLNAGTGNIDIGTGAQARTTNIATGAAVQTVTVGSTSSTSTLTLLGGSGATAVSVQAASGGGVMIGTTNSNSVTIGSTSGASEVDIQAGTGNIDLITAGSGSGTIVKNNTNSATGFQVQDASSAAIFTVDTASNHIEIGSSTTNGTAILLILDSYNGAGDPTGVLGSMYYNSTTRAMRCYSNGMWSDCDSTSLRKQWLLQEDFIGYHSNTAYSGGDWYPNEFNSSSITSVPSNNSSQDYDRFGIIGLQSAGSSNSGVELQTVNESMSGVPSNLTVEMSFGTLNSAAAAGTQQTIYAGLHDSSSGGAPTGGIFFRYSRTSTAGNWERCVAVSSTVSCTSTGISFDTTLNNYQQLRIVTNAAGTSAEFFVNGVSGGTISSGMPTNSDAYGPSMTFMTLNSTAKSWKVDYYQLKRNVTTLR